MTAVVSLREKAPAALTVTPLEPTIGAEISGMLNTLWNEYPRPEYQVRFKWRTDSVAFWDNRAAVHYAIGDYGEFPRVVKRVLIADQAAYADY
jgi:hypothetical protein